MLVMPHLTLRCNQPIKLAVVDTECVVYIVCSRAIKKISSFLLLAKWMLLHWPK